MIGFHSDMIWLPEHNVGAVILTNGDPGWIDPRRSSAASCSRCCSTASPRPTPTSRPAAKSWFDDARRRAQAASTVPADAAEAGKLAARIRNDALGEIAVTQGGQATVFDFGEWKSEVASQKNPDGTISFVDDRSRASAGLELVVGERRRVSAR